MNHKATLHFLLVLTFITAGLNLFAYGMTALLLPQMHQMAKDVPEMVPEAMRTYMDIYLSMPRLYFLGAALLYGLELLGGIRMWQLKAAGFHCYTLARLLLLLIPVLFLGKEFVQLGDIMFAALFILAYWLILKQLGVFGGNTAEGDDTPALPPEND